MNFDQRRALSTLRTDFPKGVNFAILRMMLNPSYREANTHDPNFQHPGIVALAEVCLPYQAVEHPSGNFTVKFEQTDRVLRECKKHVRVNNIYGEEM